MGVGQTTFVPSETARSLREAKIWGGLGSIFLLLTVVPYAGLVLGIAGLILVLFAVMRIAEFVGDPSIRSNMVLGIVLAVGGLAIGSLIVFAAMWRFMGLGFMSGPDFNMMNPPTTDVWAFIVAMILGLVAIWAFYLVSAVYIRRSFDSIGARLNIGMFQTAALVYLIGAALTIVMVGFLVVYVAWILFAVAFFSIPEEAPRTIPATA